MSGMGNEVSCGKKDFLGHDDSKRSFHRYCSNEALLAIRLVLVAALQNLGHSLLLQTLQEAVNKWIEIGLLLSAQKFGLRFGCVLLQFPQRLLRVDRLSTFPPQTKRPQEAAREYLLAKFIVLTVVDETRFFLISEQRQTSGLTACAEYPFARVCHAAEFPKVSKRPAVAKQRYREAARRRHGTTPAHGGRAASGQGKLQISTAAVTFTCKLWFLRKQHHQNG